MVVRAKPTPRTTRKSKKVGTRARAWNAMWRRARTGNGIWLAAAIVASGVRVIARLCRRQREVVYRSELAPGEQLTIKHTERSVSCAQRTADRR